MFGYQYLSREMRHRLRMEEVQRNTSSAAWNWKYNVFISIIYGYDSSKPHVTTSSILISCHPVIKLYVILSSCHLVILSSCHHVIMSSCQHLIENLVISVSVCRAGITGWTHRIWSLNFLLKGLNQVM